MNKCQSGAWFDSAFYRGKNVFVTGHTGFKGSWLCRMLANLGANVTGFALMPPTEPSLFGISGIDSCVTSVIKDVRDYAALKAAFDSARPEIVLHLAAQPIVRDSYKDPRYTYETNVMGTVNILECVRRSKTVRSFLNVTTDKVYKNNEWAWGYREDELLDGFDPYSNSKSCSELVTHSYKNAFFASEDSCAISTARAGNVIGGGDFAHDRIIPDCVRSALKGESIIVRNPYSTRPYQHVLEPLFAYLMIAQKQYADKRFAGWYNVGPDECDCVTTGALVDTFCNAWNAQNALNGDNVLNTDNAMNAGFKCGKNRCSGESNAAGSADTTRADSFLSWKNVAEENAPHEATFLKLDCSKIKSTFGWKPCMHIAEAVQKTVSWMRVYRDKGDVLAEMDAQIADYKKRIDLNV